MSLFISDIFHFCELKLFNTFFIFINSSKHRRHSYKNENLAAKKFIVEVEKTINKNEDIDVFKK